MNRKSASSTGSSRQSAEAQPLLGFNVWITPFRGATPTLLAAFQRRVEDYLIERDLQGSGTPLQMLIASDDRNLTATDQVDLLFWLAGQAAVATVEIGPLLAHSGLPGERGNQPVVVARFGDLALIPMAWLYGGSRLTAAQVIEMLGGYRSTATLH